MRLLSPHSMTVSQLSHHSNFPVFSVPFDEEFSDRCMGELMGTGRSDGRTCIMTPQCLGAMFIRGLGEYQITHQLLYMMLAEQVATEFVYMLFLCETNITG